MNPEVAKHIEDHFDEYVAELVSLVKMPSVSATGEGVEACASHLADRMRELGIDLRVYPIKDGNPIIIGRIGGGSDRVLLVYDHYDVQPPDPLEEWDKDPFSGEISKGKIHGRGATDSKGNLMAYLSALRSLRETVGLPISVKFLFEGDEEIASPPLKGFIEGHGSELKADAVVCCDGDLDPSGRPMITLGMKGLIYVELRCRKGRTDLHSSKAALVPSAAWRLVDALCTLRDEDGRIAIPGWEEGKLEPTDEDMELMAKIPFDEEKTQEELGVSEFLRDAHGMEALRGYLYDPTCNIAGLTSGYQGEGSKTVLPAEARAKLDMRLVYDQDPGRCVQLLRSHLAGKGFSDVEVVLLGSAEPSHTPIDAPIARAAARAAEAVYEVEPVIYPKHHASGPDYLFSKTLGLHSIWTGCAPAFGNAHGPNEFIGLEDYRLGILYACELMERFAKCPD